MAEPLPAGNHDDLISSCALDKVGVAATGHLRRQWSHRTAYRTTCRRSYVSEDLRPPHSVPGLARQEATGDMLRRSRAARVRRGPSRLLGPSMLPNHQLSDSQGLGIDDARLLAMVRPERPVIEWASSTDLAFLVMEGVARYRAVRGHLDDGTVR